MDTENLHLYTYNAENDLTKTDLNTLKTDVHTYRLDVGAFASSIFYDDRFHIIGGDISNKHIALNNEHKFDEIHEFKEFSKGFSGHGLVHLKSKNVWLLFGGYDDGVHKDCKSIYV